MSFSVNTNVGAMTALQYLTETGSMLSQTQSAINSGLKSSGYQGQWRHLRCPGNQRASVAGYQSVLNSLNNGSSSIDVALSAGQSISDLLIQLKTQALSAADPSLDTASRQALNASFTFCAIRVTTIWRNAVFNNFNLVDGSTQMIQALASSDGTRRVTTCGPGSELSGAIVNSDLRPRSPPSPRRRH